MIQSLFSLFLVALFSIISCEKLEYFTFEPPFEEIDTIGGQRVINNFRSSGTTVVNANFIRLTPDRQSKKGALWSRKSLGVPSLSTIFKFRISGKYSKTFIFLI